LLYPKVVNGFDVVVFQLEYDDDGEGCTDVDKLDDDGTAIVTVVNGFS
jgi:hypothetical protein